MSLTFPQRVDRLVKIQGGKLDSATDQIKSAQEQLARILITMTTAARGEIYWDSASREFRLDNELKSPLLQTSGVIRVNCLNHVRLLVEDVIGAAEDAWLPMERSK